jgi:hypothetical protein
MVPILVVWLKVLVDENGHPLDAKDAAGVLLFSLLFSSFDVGYPWVSLFWNRFGCDGSFHNVDRSIEI